MLLLVLVVVGIYVPVFALLPSLSYTPQSLPSAIPQDEKMISRKFYIKDDNFWKDGNRFQIIGGDLHYFRVLPEIMDAVLGGSAFKSQCFRLEYYSSIRSLESA
jgi:beta-galactosidase